MMPIGSRAKSCVRPECLECIIYPSPSRQIPHLTTLHSPCGPNSLHRFHLTEGSRNRMLTGSGTTGNPSRVQMV